jgi:UDP-N-acetylmuramate--alanine ligase
MENIQLIQFKGKHIHFVGIGGISMSGLAEILLGRGYIVSGSDLNDSHIIKRLREKGATIHIGHSVDNVKGADLVVYTAAIKEENPEIQEALRLKIPMMDRATLLGQLMKTFRYSIGVSGTHGKTTTTSMLSVIMNHAELDPTILVGGELDEIGGNIRTGNSNYFVTEACEYCNSFLKFYPYIAIILNIEEDHLDFFKDIDDIYESFLKYAQLVPRNGYVVGCADDLRVSKLLEQVNCRTLSFGLNGSGDWSANNITYDEKGCASYRAVYKGQDMGRFSLTVPGEHNIYNALAASAAAWALGISREVIRDSLSTYSGTHRRFEKKGELNGITVIDDYAHHPTEIKATLKTAVNYPHKRLWCVFQPHTYTRTKKLFCDFVKSLSGIHELILVDIYAAREKDTGEIHSRDLAEAINNSGQSAIYLPSFEETVQHLRQNAESGDVIITMGAGTVHQIGEKFLGSPPIA